MLVRAAMNSWGYGANVKYLSDDMSISVCELPSVGGRRFCGGQTEVRAFICWWLTISLHYHSKLSILEDRFLGRRLSRHPDTNDEEGSLAAHEAVRMICAFVQHLNAMVTVAWCFCRHQCEVYYPSPRHPWQVQGIFLEPSCLPLRWVPSDGS